MVTEGVSTLACLLIRRGRMQTLGTLASLTVMGASCTCPRPLTAQACPVFYKHRLVCILGQDSQC